MGLSWKFPNHIDFDWFHGTDLYAMIHIYIYNLIYNRYMYTHIFTRYVHIYIYMLYRVLFWCPMGCDLIGD